MPESPNAFTKIVFPGFSTSLKVTDKAKCLISVGNTFLQKNQGDIIEQEGVQPKCNQILTSNFQITGNQGMKEQVTQPLEKAEFQKAEDLNAAAVHTNG